MLESFDFGGWVGGIRRSQRDAREFVLSGSVFFVL